MSTPSWSSVKRDLTDAKLWLRVACVDGWNAETTGNLPIALSIIARVEDIITRGKKCGYFSARPVDLSVMLHATMALIRVEMDRHDRIMSPLATLATRPSVYSDTAFSIRGLMMTRNPNLEDVFDSANRFVGRRHRNTVTTKIQHSIGELMTSEILTANDAHS